MPFILLYPTKDFSSTRPPCAASRHHEHDIDIWAHGFGMGSVLTFTGPDENRYCSASWNSGVACSRSILSYRAI